VHRIKWDDNVLYPYKEWGWEVKDSDPSFDLFFTGVGGVVYPPNFFNGIEQKLEEIKNYIIVDDIFLNDLCRKQKMKVKRIEMQNNYKDINILPFKSKLCTINILFNNDCCLNKIKFHTTLLNCKNT
jgi:hypothetical protein